MVVAEMSLVARRGDTVRDAAIRVHCPELDPKCSHGSTFRTKLEFNGFDRPRYIPGEGSLQSLALTFSYIRTKLNFYARGGWQFYYPDSDEPLEPTLNLFADKWIPEPDGDDSDSDSAPL